MQRKPFKDWSRRSKLITLIGSALVLVALLSLVAVEFFSGPSQQEVAEVEPPQEMEQQDLLDEEQALQQDLEAQLAALWEHNDSLVLAADSLERSVEQSQQRADSLDEVITALLERGEELLPMVAALQDSVSQLESSQVYLDSVKQHLLSYLAELGLDTADLRELGKIREEQKQYAEAAGEEFNGLEMGAFIPAEFPPEVLANGDTIVVHLPLGELKNDSTFQAVLGPFYFGGKKHSLWAKSVPDDWRNSPAKLRELLISHLGPNGYSELIQATAKFASEGKEHGPYSAALLLYDVKPEKFPGYSPTLSQEDG